MIGKISQMLYVTTVIDQDISGIVTNKPPMTPTMPMTPMTDSGIDEDSYMQIFECAAMVNTNVDHDGNVMVDNNESPSSVMDSGNEQEPTLQVFSNSSEQPQDQCPLAENSTLTSNYTNVEEKNEENFCVDDLSDILDGNDLITTINHTELLDLLPGLLQ